MRQSREREIERAARVPILMCAVHEEKSSVGAETKEEV